LPGINNLLFSAKLTVMPLNRVKALYAVYFLFISFITTATRAQDGTFDASFGTSGKTFIEFSPAGNSSPLSIILQPDGKIIQYGQAFNTSISRNNVDILLTRVLSSGTPDPAFGSGGKIRIPIGDGYPESHSRALALQPDGKIVVAASYYNPDEFYHEMMVVRLNPDGSKDINFGIGGKVTINHGLYDDYAKSVAVQADGKILVGGSSTNNGSFFQYTVARLNPNGSLDSGFDLDGIKTFSFSSSNEVVKVIKIQDDGKILLAGNSWYFNYDYLVVRLNPDGSFDTSFDSDGYAFFPVGPNDDSPADLEIQPDGKILLGGSSQFPPNRFFSIVRLNPNGSFDHTFSGDGKLTFHFGVPVNHGYSIELQKDGKILMAGGSYHGSVLLSSIARLTSDGSFDESFDGDGKLIFNVNNTDWSFLADIILQEDGKILGSNSYFPGMSLFRLHNSSAASSLPVSLNDFSASLLHGQVNVNWETSHEVNNKGFYIQRAMENAGGSLTWKDVGFVGGANNYGVHKYSFVDKEPLEGTSHYRLKQVDYDEKTKFSITKLIKLTKNRLQFRLSPNPVSSGPVTINLFSNFSGPAKLVVTDMIGRVQLHKTVMIKNGRLTSSVELTGFLRGVYTMRLSSGEQQWTERFILSNE
jgi:uncharacterized delta-60 repeat protein